MKSRNDHSPFYRCSVTALVGALLGLILMPQRGAARPQESTGRSTPCPSSPFDVSLAFERLPAVGERAAARLVVTSRVLAPDVAIDLMVPEGLAVEGPLAWRIALVPGEPFEVEIPVTVLEEGNYALEARARTRPSEHIVWSGLGRACFHAGLGHAEAWFVERPGRYGLGVAPSPGNLLEVGDAATYLATDLGENPPRLSRDSLTPPSSGGTRGGVVIKGSLRYFEKGYLPKGAASVLAQLFDSSGKVIATTFTDSVGRFQFAAVANPGIFFVKWYTYSWPAWGSTLAVRVPGTSNDWSNSWNVGTNVLWVTGSTTDIGQWTVKSSSLANGAFWILGYMVRAWQYCEHNRPLGTKSAGSTYAEWMEWSNDKDRFSGGIVHLSGPSKYSEDTVVHEMGHSIMQNLYGFIPDTPSCDPHYIHLASSVECAWVEGWADFLAIGANPDTKFTWSNGSSIDLEAPTWGTPGWDDGLDVEGRVAGGLYDLLDSHNEGYDKSSLGFDEIWRVVATQSDYSFSDFWFAWKQFGFEQTNALWTLAQNTLFP